MLLWQIKHYIEDCECKSYKTIKDCLGDLRLCEVQMDCSMLGAVAKACGVDMHLNGDTKPGEEFFPSNNSFPGKTLELYYFGGGKSGYYQVIAPKLKNGEKRVVHFDRSEFGRDPMTFVGVSR